MLVHLIGVVFILNFDLNYQGYCNCVMDCQELLSKAFMFGDINKRGYLNKEDLKVAMLFLFGYKPSKYEINQLMKCEKQIKDDNLCMTFSTFKSVMLCKLQAEDEDQKIRELFCMLDVKCQGYLTEEDIQLAFKHIAPNLSNSNILACWTDLCKHKDSKLSYREFEHVLKSV